VRGAIEGGAVECGAVEGGAVEGGAVEGGAVEGGAPSAGDGAALEGTSSGSGSGAGTGGPDDGGTSPSAVRSGPARSALPVSGPAPSRPWPVGSPSPSSSLVAIAGGNVAPTPDPGKIASTSGVASRLRPDLDTVIDSVKISRMETPWSLEELSRRVEAVLAHGVQVDQQNGQVREVPNARTIRYYTTIGLLDRPRLQGRSATYGRRHLAQLVAIKRLQARGLPLAEVQREIVGLDDDALARIAALPADLPADLPAGVEAALAPALGPPPQVESRRERSFWGEAPAAPVAGSASGVSAPTPASPITGLHLSEGVTLAFLAARTVDDDDLEALRAALQPVVETLRARGLLAAAEEGEEP
jgi:DNA-binding transcriptional MerR regulator